MLDVEIPANTTASLYVPAVAADAITENGKPLPEQKEISVSGKEGKYIVLQVGSGTYHFSASDLK